MGFLRRNLSNCPKELKGLAYITLVWSKLEYAACVWNPHLEKDIKQLEGVQRRSARFVCRNYDWSSSVTAMLEDLEWEPLEQRRSDACLYMFYTIVNLEVAVNINEHLDQSYSHQLERTTTSNFVILEPTQKRININFFQELS